MRHIGRIRLIGLIAAIIIAGFLLRLPENREWVEVNLLTVSTRAKQAKYLELAARHLPDDSRLYADYLRKSEEMAEAIVFLDGKQIAVAEKFEEVTRLQEAELISQRPVNFESLAAARIENEKIFKFMATKYQFDEQDIEKHKAILGKHIALVEKEIASADLDRPRNDKIRQLLTEAKKYQAAGLNVEAYDLIGEAKLIMTSALPRQ